MPRTATPLLESLAKRKAEFIEPMECALVSTLPEGPGAFLGYSDREIPQASGRPSGTVDVVEEPTEF